MTQTTPVRAAAGARWFIAPVAVVLIVIGAVVVLALPAPEGQGLDGVNRGRVKSMLAQVRDAIRKDYYDPTFHGLDIDAHFKAAADRLETANSLGYAFGVIAQALLDFNDSHTFFIPASRPIRVEYGWLMQMIGDRCFVTAVNPKSDAAAKGLKAGDEILMLGNFKPSRQELWKIKYFFNALNPVTSMRMVVRAPGAGPRELQVASKATQRKRVVDLTGGDGGMDIDDYIREIDAFDTRSRFVKVGRTTIWKLPDFSIEPREMNDLFDDIITGAEALVLDLRANPGGDVETLQALVGRFFDHDVKVADRTGRKAQDVKPVIAKKGKGKVFEGKLVVLVDGESGSASEVLARVMQIEKRGVVIGDRSSGSVMAATRFVGQTGADALVFFGASITVADLVMSDGKSLERVGVQPDELILPSPEDLGASRDPVLARAAATLGIDLDPGKAGKIFPVAWK